MATTMVRVSKETGSVLREIASQTGETIQDVLQKAVEAYQRQRFFDELDAAYAALRGDPEAWAAEQQERAEWEAVLMDGLPRHEQWDEDNGEGNRG